MTASVTISHTGGVKPVLVKTSSGTSYILKPFECAAVVVYDGCDLTVTEDFSTPPLAVVETEADGD